jgi:hypothetical protein
MQQKYSQEQKSRRPQIFARRTRRGDGIVAITVAPEPQNCTSAFVATQGNQNCTSVSVAATTPHWLLRVKASVELRTVRQQFGLIFAVLDISPG